MCQPWPKWNCGTFLRIMSLLDICFYVFLLLMILFAMIRWGMPRLLFCFICLAKSIIRYSRELCKACLVQPRRDMTSARRQFRTRRHTAGNHHKTSQNDAHGVSANWNPIGHANRGIRLISMVRLRKQLSAFSFRVGWVALTPTPLPTRHLH